MKEIEQKYDRLKEWVYVKEINMDEEDQYERRRWWEKCGLRRCVWMKKKSVDEGLECGKRR